MQAPDEGPSELVVPASGIGGRPSTKRLTVGQRNDPRLLRAVAMKYDIDSTKSLVAAYNKTTDKDERAVLLKWLRNYGRRSEECLRLESVLEYAELSKIKSRSTHEDDVLGDLVDGLCSCLRQTQFLKPNTAIALCRTLTHADPSSYGGTAQLVNVAKNLLGTLSPRLTLTIKNFAKHEATFLALHQTFFLLHMSNHNDIDEKEKQDLRRAIAAKENELELSCKYYPVRFHFKALRQAVERLELRDAPSHVTQAMRCVACGLCALLHVFHCFRNLTRCDIDPAAIADAYGKSQAYFVDMGASKRAWFDSFRTLMAARLAASKTEVDFGHFEVAYRAAIKEEQTTRDREDLKALRFGIIQELGVLVNKGSPEHVRRDVALKLTELTAQQAVDGGWIDDDDVLVALSDVLRDTDAITECNEETKEALRVLYESCRSGASKELMELMKAKDMEDRPRNEISQALQEERKNLCTEIGRDMGYVPPAVINSNREDLRRTYIKDDFATVASLFEKGSRKHVKDMKHHVVIDEEIVEKREIRSRDGTDEAVQGVEARERMPSDRGRDHAKEYYEQRTKVTKPIALDDLFKKRSIKPGDPESDVRRVLVCGNPGSGKTCITKVIAHKWALREMAQEFNAVYVVPVRVLNSAESNGQQWTSLEGAISRICFSKRKRTSEYEDLALQIEDDLDSPSTLLVVDGLDEANDNTREIVSTIWERSCKVLFLSRPYNMRKVVTRVDVQVECLGFNDHQLRDYIESELKDDQAPKLIESLQSSTAMWEMAHIPVTAHILCSLSAYHGTATEERGKRKSIFQIYNDMANYVWERFKEKPAVRNIKRCDLFDDLERTAFETFRSGLILIPPRLVTQYATSTDAAGTFKESGLLLLVMEGQQYQFPHLTFQEYFAGRHIAKNLQRRDSKEKTRALDFVQEGKYNQKHALTLSFAMHAFANDLGKHALQEMLSIVDDEPVEVLGIQHFLLRMQVLEATLEEANESDLKTLVKEKEAVKIAKGARELLVSAMDNVLIRKVVVGKFDQCRRVLEKFPAILNVITDDIKRVLASPQKLTWKTEDKTKNMLKLAKHSPKHMSEIYQWLLQLQDKVEEWCDTRECITRFEWIVSEVPQLAGDLLPMLVRGWGDEDSSVRANAKEAVGRVVGALPQLAGDLLPMLVMGCGDKDSVVRMNAIEAVGQAVGATPQLAGDLLPMLVMGCGDEDSSVRWNAMMTVGRLVGSAPQLAGDLLPMLVSGCGEEDNLVRMNAMEAVGRAVGSAPQLAGDLLPILVRGCGDEDSSVRRKAIKAVGRLVGSAPQFAGDLLPILVRGCGDENSPVRWNAMEAVGRAVGATPQLAGDLLPMLVRGCGDEDNLVRMNAIEAVGRAVGAAPQLAGDLLPMLVRGCGDKDSVVRWNAMMAVGRLVGSAPQFAGDLLPILVRGCGDEYARVRWNAMMAVGRLVGSAPQFAGDLLPILVRGCGDENSPVRWNAMEAVGRAVGATPQLAGDLLPMLVRGCGDGDSSVRRNAMEAVGRAVGAAPQLAGDLLPMLVRGCDDEDARVRDKATATLDGLNLNMVISLAIKSSSVHGKGFLIIFIRTPTTLSIPTEDDMRSVMLHNVASEDIGTWTKDTLACSFQQLKEELYNSFPGLMLCF